jgi:multidrug resistance efflux pump
LIVRVGFTPTRCWVVSEWSSSIRPMDSSTLAIRRLRPGLEIFRTGPRAFLLRNRATGGQLQLGAEERFLLHLLERAKSFHEISGAFEKKFRRRLPERQVLEFWEQLHGLGLTENAAKAGVSMAQPGRDDHAGQMLAAPRPLSRSDPHANLNLFFDLLIVLFGWIFHPIWIVPVVTISLMATIALFFNWDRYTGEFIYAFQVVPKLPLLIFELVQTVLLVSLARTVLSAMVCRRFGGRITKFGFKMIGYLVPTFYIEANQLQVLTNERGKWTWLGIDFWTRMTIASLGILAMSASRPYSFQALFYAGVIAPCLLGLFYHLIIFYEQSSSYWLLSYHVDDHRLRQRALAETNAWLAMRRSPEALTEDQRYWFRAFGLGFYAFRVIFDSFVWVFLGRWLITKYNEIGALLLVCGIIWAYRESIGRAIMNIEKFRWFVRTGGKWQLRWAARGTLLAAVVCLGFMPYDYEIVGECRVFPGEQRGVRTRLEDEIESVNVSEGEHVEVGTLIATLKGHKARSDVKVLEAKLAAAKANLDLYRNGYRPEDIKVAAEQVEIDKLQLDFAQKDWARTVQLDRQNWVSMKEVDQKLLNLGVARETLVSGKEVYSKYQKGYREEERRAAEADYKSVEEQLNYAREMLALTRIVSPLRGQVVTAYMKEKVGQPTKVGDLIAVISDPTKLHAEVAAADAAALTVKEGMPVNIRLFGTYGRLMTGRVRKTSPSVERYGKFGNSTIRNDPELYTEESANYHFRNPYYQMRVYVDLDEIPAGLTTEMTGYARIFIEEDVLWRALARPIAKFLQTEVWSWLP